MDPTGVLAAVFALVAGYLAYRGKRQANRVQERSVAHEEMETALGAQRDRIDDLERRLANQRTDYQRQLTNQKSDYQQKLHVQDIDCQREMGLLRGEMGKLQGAIDFMQSHYVAEIIAAVGNAYATATGNGPITGETPAVQ